VPTQLAGNRLEMSPKDLASGGVTYSPATGFFASAQVQFVGARFLNKRNTALAEQYETWSAGVGWRWEHWDVRLDAENINDARPAVAESELGDAQYYRLPARSFMLSGHLTF
jgi:outer membrane receptor protein involved in Fe transport